MSPAPCPAQRGVLPVSAGARHLRRSLDARSPSDESGQEVDESKPLRSFKVFEGLCLPDVRRYLCVTPACHVLRRRDIPSVQIT